MAKRKFTLTEKEQQELRGAYERSTKVLARTKYLAVRMYGEGYVVTEIEAITGCRRSSLMEWCQEYEKDGIPGLADKRVGGNSAKLSKLQIEELGYRLRQYTPRNLYGPEAGNYWTVPDLVRAIKKWYSVEYRSPSSYLRVFAMCGFSYQRAEKVYKPRSEQKSAGL